MNLYPDRKFEDNETPNPNMRMGGWVRVRNAEKNSNERVHMENIDHNTNLERFQKDSHWTQAATEITWTTRGWGYLNYGSTQQTMRLPWCKACDPTVRSGA